MDEKRSSLPRSKRSKPLDEGAWECSVCTYRNSQEAFKCEMCDVRKGTSTRKPRLNSQLVAQQVAQQFPPPPPKKEKLMITKKEKDRDGKDKEKASTSHSGGTGSGGKKSGRVPRLKNIDRSSGVSMEVTVGSLTVVITDYKPKKDKSVTSSESNRSNLSINSDSNASSTDLKSESSQSMRVDTDEESRDGSEKKS